MPHEAKLENLRNSLVEETVEYTIRELTNILEKLKDKPTPTNTEHLKGEYKELKKVTKRLESIVGCLETIGMIDCEVNPPSYF